MNKLSSILARLFKEEKLEPALEWEIIKSEIFRTKIVFWFYLLGSFAFTFQLFFIRSTIEVALKNPNFPFWVPILFFLTNSVYAKLLLLFLEKKLSQKKKPPSWVIYCTGLVETIFPSFAILFLAFNYPVPILAFATPPVFVYFVFLILATLRLNERLAFFIGFSSWIQYNSIAYFLINYQDNSGADALHLSMALYFAKSNFFLICGFLSGFVARQIKKAIRTTLNSEKEKIQIRNLFGQHVSPSVVNRLLEQTDDWSGELKHVCIVFFDIRNFTKMTESLPARELIHFLNSIFTESIEAVNANGGIINKFLGDGFLAVFGAPFSNGDDVAKAVEASLDIDRRLTLLKQKEDKFHPFEYGIGIHCGEAITGNVGSADRKEYTVMGDVVNVASRIEQLNKDYRSKILASKEVVDCLSAQRPVFLDKVMLKGKSQPIEIYKIL